MIPGMYSQKLTLGHFRRIETSQHIEKSGCNELIFYRGQAPGILRVTFAGVMFVTFGMAEIGCRQN